MTIVPTKIILESVGAEKTCKIVGMGILMMTDTKDELSFEAIMKEHGMRMYTDEAEYWAKKVWNHLMAIIEVNKREEAEKVAELVAVIEVLKHTIREVRHAQESGPGWYTRGAAGLYQQVRMWLDKADAAIKSVEADKP